MTSSFYRWSHHHYKQFDEIFCHFIAHEFHFFLLTDRQTYLHQALRASTTFEIIEKKFWFIGSYHVISLYMFFPPYCLTQFILTKNFELCMDYFLIWKFLIWQKKLSKEIWRDKILSNHSCALSRHRARQPELFSYSASNPHGTWDWCNWDFLK